MKNLFFALFSLFLIAGFTSCGDDEPDCKQSDWVGTYTYQGTIEECEIDDNSSIEYEETIEIKAGATDLSISIDGFEGVFNETTCTATVFILGLELDGDILKLLPNTDCEGIYKKN